METIRNFLLFAAQYGIWGIISVIVLLTSFVVAIRYLYFPKFNVPNLNIYLNHERDFSDYPSKIFFEISNYTNVNIVLSNAYFIPNKLFPDSKARGDSSSRKYELKFPPDFYQPDCLLIRTKNTLTWFPIDPFQSDDEINNILNNKEAGTFNCKCTMLYDRPKTYKLKINISQKKHLISKV
jgi:hypothetical protein